MGGRFSVTMVIHEVFLHHSISQVLFPKVCGFSVFQEKTPNFPQTSGFPSCLTLFLILSLLKNGACIQLKSGFSCGRRKKKWGGGGDDCGFFFFGGGGARGRGGHLSLSF